MKLYLDEDSQDHRLIRALRAARFDIVSSGESGMDGATDEAQLAFAFELGRAIYTANARDFSILHRDLVRTGQPYAGIIIRSQRLPLGKQITALTVLLELAGDEGLGSLLEFLSDWVE